MKETETETTQETSTPHITWFTPSVGATSTNCVLFNLLQKPQFDLRTQLQILSVLKKPRTQQQAPAHTAAGLSSIFFTQTLCAHSCRGRPCTQLGLNLLYTINLNLALIFLTSQKT